MKKLLLPLLALCGMITGLTLTSCGGGGGDSNRINMSGITISLQSGLTYDMIFGDKRMGTDSAYSVTITSPDGSISEATVNITAWPAGTGKLNDIAGLIGLQGSLSADSYQYDDMELFFNAIGLGGVENNDGELPDTQTLYAPATFRIEPTEKFAVGLVWTLQAQELDEEEEEEGAENPGDEPTPGAGTQIKYVPFDLPEHSVIGVYRQ